MCYRVIFARLTVSGHESHTVTVFALTFLVGTEHQIEFLLTVLKRNVFVIHILSKIFTLTRTSYPFLNKKDFR